MDKSCSNCEHWRLLDDGERLPDAIKDTHKECTKAVFDKGDNREAIKSSPMVTCDGSGYLGILYTAGNHCCKEWTVQE